MKNQISKWFAHGSWLVALVVIGVSCNDAFGPESKSPVNSKLSAQYNAEMMAASQDVMDVTGSGMVSQGITYGRVADEDGEDHEHRLCGAHITKSFDIDTTLPDSIIFTGSITIDFGDGSQCADSANRRSGKITTEFTINVSLKNHHYYNSVETVTLEGFKHNSKSINGVFIAKASTGGKRWLKVLNASFKHHGDGVDEDDDGDEDSDNDEDSVTTITWSGELTFTHNSGGTYTREDDTDTIEGSITGTTDAGATFSSTITSAVTFKWACYRGRNIPVSGKVDINSAGVVTTLDFGDGTCDKLYTSTTAGTTTELHF